ncbi:serine hydrolase domain-containing protein [Paenibacillus thailandensis]|uniref:Serine hydrolase domain-containing protein n=1 Tax=Paenibacillus thailandensis TaxID=393250 RepID=A0ABW5R4K9_9BACL
MTINRLSHDRLDRLIQSAVDRKRIFGAVLSVESGDKRFAWTGAGGYMRPDSRFYIASTTKLFVTASVLKLRELKQADLNDPISRYLEEDILSGLHRYQGIEYSRGITVGQLMAQTSGLPDYFQHKRDNGKSLMQEIVAGNDRAWSFGQVIEDAKRMKPHFPPGRKGKALYSDTNYQLLGKIIENIANQPLNDVFERLIYEPLGLSDTYLYADSRDRSPAPFYYKAAPLHTPLAMASFGPDGAIVSTSGELMRFVRAFFEGELFPKAYLNELYVWNKIFFPLQYGVGMMRFKLPAALSPFRPVPELLGHSGISGAFAYYCPKKDVFLTGTVNQTSNPGLPYKLMVRVLNLT